MKKRNSAPSEEISFYKLVKGCATEPQLIESFNRAYDARLQVPIEALQEDRWPHDVSAEEETQIGYFILFVHEHIWQRLRRAQARIGRGFSS